MRFKACILIVSLCGPSLIIAQSDQQPAKSTSSSSSAPDKSSVSFVRRFSAGVTLSVLGFSTISGGTSTVDVSSSVVDTYTTKGGSSRIGYGVSGQMSITDHFAVNVGGFYRKLGYQLTNSIATTTNVLEGNTVVPTTITTSTHEDTRTHVYDFPLLVRYYGKSRHTPGPRWFVEGGGAYRDVTHIRTSLDSTDADAVNTCCTFTATQPQHKSATGLVVGAGLQLIDPFGIRVIPEIRYTRWRNEIYDDFSTHTQKNQLEASITLSF